MRHVALVLALLGAISTVTMSVSTIAQACPQDERGLPWCDEGGCNKGRCLGG
jgi:hypothetical protein